MKRKEFNDLKGKKIEDLVKFLKAKKLEHVKVKAKMAQGGEKNLKVAKNLRLEIARIATLITEKEIIEKEAI
ncbi:MAG: 50S ribosomal protein L29 [bacterium]|nr:50S ribosomal protein L29 [bacterium]